MRLFATDFWATYRVTRPFELPHHSGSLLRGVLGRALRLHGCATPAAPCAQDCLQPGRCAYSRLFDPPVPDPLPHPFLRGSTHAPRPLIPVFPRPGKAHLAAGDTLEFGLRMLGPLQADDTERLFAAIEHVAELPIGMDAGSVEFRELRQRGPRNRVIEVGPGKPERGQWVVDFETPVWLAHKGRLLNPDALDFPTLFRHAYRRLTTLAALYGELPADSASTFRDLDQLAPGVHTVSRHLRVLKWERLTLEREERLPMMGLWGSILFDGPIGPFLPVLRAVELTHLGKATSHGLGRIRVSHRPA